MRPTTVVLSSCLVFFLTASGARANTVTFDLFGIMTDDSFLTGSFTIDEVAGTATAIDFILSAPDSETFTVLDGQGADGSAAWSIGGALTGQLAGSLPSFTLLLPTTTLVGYAGGLLCSTVNPCNMDNEVTGVIPSSGSTTDGPFLFLGEAVPESPVPEPTSLALVSLGLVALVVRRRIAFPN